ncbi:hypothetical protein WJF14_23375, partial [Salmonella enterica subsp. enterica serovar Corvallis]
NVSTWTIFLQPVAEAYADIYWGLLTEPPSSIFSVYQLWKPWIQSLCPDTSPPGPPHVTLFYDRCHTEWYQICLIKQLKVGHDLFHPKIFMWLLRVWLQQLI